MLPTLHAMCRNSWQGHLMPLRFRIFNEVHPHIWEEHVSTRYLANTPVMWGLCNAITSHGEEPQQCDFRAARLVCAIVSALVRNGEWWCSITEWGSSAVCPRPPAELNNCACVIETCMCCAIYCSGCVNKWEGCRNTWRNTSAKRYIRYVYLLLVKSSVRGVYI